MLILFKNKLLAIAFTLQLLLPSIALSDPASFPRGTHDIYIPKVNGVRTDILQNITQVIDLSISQGYYPGAVVLITHHGKIIYRGVFGNRRILPTIAPMQLNTIFDLASLTKVLATAPAIMQLVEQGKINLDNPVSYYWPTFTSHGKDTITIRELLTHTSGLPIGIKEGNIGSEKIFEQIENLRLDNTPGSIFSYSDVNFLVLAHLVEIISSEKFDQYVQHHLYKPLAMQHTFFLPAEKLRDQIAPTEKIDDKILWGVVDDPTARAMGGVAGSAGLFSNAQDINIFAECLLNNGRMTNNKYLLGPLTILKMTTPQTPDRILDVRGFGWDIDSVYSNRGILFPLRSYGHTGWTGTSVWIDPVTHTSIIILTSRAHPTPAPNNQLIQDRRTIANIVAASLTDVSIINLTNTGMGELSRVYTETVPVNVPKQLAINHIFKEVILS